jgi:DNA-binding NtrC family response regulator
VGRSPERAAILLVDDDPMFRAVLADFLCEDGFAVLVYGSPGQVPPLDTLDQLALMITDYEMPEENGLAFADRFHAVHPNIPVVLLTGHRADTLAGSLRERRFVHLCSKPFLVDEFHSLLQTVLSPECRVLSAEC